jgi:DNA-directed RNA polymerase sigma subunit (sigma70/sigma32)
MEFDWSMLLAYATPILTALGTLVAALVKIKELCKKGQENIEKAAQGLYKKNNVEELNNKMQVVMQENAELKKMLKRQIELMTRVRYEDDTTNKNS